MGLVDCIVLANDEEISLVEIIMSNIETFSEEDKRAVIIFSPMIILADKLFHINLILSEIPKKPVVK
jgi:hypothetical protein